VARKLFFGIKETKSLSIVLGFVLLRPDIRLDTEGAIQARWIDQRTGKKRDILKVSMEETKETYIRKPNLGIMQEMLFLAQALVLAVDKRLMKQEHAGAIWKRMLTLTGVDTTKKGVTK
jgi:hypothetical protein